MNHKTNLMRIAAALCFIGPDVTVFPDRGRLCFYDDMSVFVISGRRDFSLSVRQHKGEKQRTMPRRTW